MILLENVRKTRARSTPLISGSQVRVLVHPPSSLMGSRLSGWQRNRWRKCGPSGGHSGPETELIPAIRRASADCLCAPLSGPGLLPYGGPRKAALAKAEDLLLQAPFERQSRPTDHLLCRQLHWVGAGHDCPHDIRR